MLRREPTLKERIQAAETRKANSQPVTPTSREEAIWNALTRPPPRVAELEKNKGTYTPPAYIDPEEKEELDLPTRASTISEVNNTQTLPIESKREMLTKQTPPNTNRSVLGSMAEFCKEKR